MLQACIGGYCSDKLQHCYFIYLYIELFILLILIPPYAKEML